MSGDDAFTRVDATDPTAEKDAKMPLIWKTSSTRYSETAFSEVAGYSVEDHNLDDDCSNYTIQDPDGNTIAQGGAAVGDHFASCKAAAEAILPSLLASDEDDHEINFSGLSSMFDALLEKQEIDSRLAADGQAVIAKAKKLCALESDWRPLFTARSDKTPVEVMDAHGNIYIAYYDRKFGGGRWVSCTERGQFICSLNGHTPKAWRPRPEK